MKQPKKESPPTITEYLIKFDPRLKGWLAFRIQKTIGPKSEVLDRTAVTTVKSAAHLAARSLARFILIGNHAE